MLHFVRCLNCNFKRLGGGNIGRHSDGDTIRGLCTCVDKSAAKNALDMTTVHEVTIVPDGVLMVEHEVRWKELVEMLDTDNVDYEIEVLPEGKCASYDNNANLKVIGGLGCHRVSDEVVTGGTEDSVGDKELYEFLSNYGWYAKVLLRIREYGAGLLTEFGIGCIAEEQPRDVLLVSHGNVE